MSSQTASSRNPKEALLLAITPRQDVASGIETRLRDAGRNVRVDWLDKPANLEDYLSEHMPVLFCCQPFANGTDTLETLLERCLNTAPDIPVVLIDDIENRLRAELMLAGARDVVAPRDSEHQVAALGRELDNARMRLEADRDRDRVKQLEYRLEEVLAESQDAHATILEGIHARLNPTYAELFGFESPEELEGVPLMDLVEPSNRSRVKKKLAACRRSKDHDEPIRFTGQRADDSPCSVLMYCHPVQVDGEDAVEIVIPHSRHNATHGDIEARAALHHALAQAGVDAFEEVEGLYFVVVDDLDGLQERQGVAKTDEVLDELGLFLLDSMHDNDQCFRFDTGEFVMICSRSSVEQLRSSAESLRAAIDKEIFGDEASSASLTVSIAVNVIAADMDRDALLLRAMRRAREASTGMGDIVTLETASEGQPSDETTDRDWLELIREGLQEDRFTFAYQSIASLEGGDAEHFEVMLRLINKGGGILHPQQFIDGARRHNLLPEIDRHVVRKILVLLAQRRERKVQGMFFLTLSDATLGQAPEFLEWLHGNLAEMQIEPKDLRLSMTEDNMRGNMRRTQQLADGLKDLGLSLTIERFGTTGKSLQLLERVPVDFAKLDAAATEALAGDESDPRIVEAVEAARKRDIRLIAQQVADANTMARLWQVGISYVQGQSVQEPEGTGDSINVA